MTESKSDKRQAGNTTAPPSDANIARERTFNEQLRRLIVKIEDHEISLTPPESGFTDEDLDTATAEAVYRKLHGLYYRLSMLDDLRSSNIQYNPFMGRGEGAPSDIDSLCGEISRAINCAGLRLFTMLGYSLPSKCYLPLCNVLGMPDRSNFILGLKHQLYTKITGEGRGIIIGKKELTNDPFYGRISNWSGFTEDFTLYAVAADSLTRPLIHEILGTVIPQAAGFIPPPILLAAGGDDAFGSGIDAVFSALSESVAVPLLYLWSLVDEIPAVDNDSHHSIINGCVDILLSRGKGCCAVIGCDVDNVEGLFTMRFLAEKCRAALSPGSIVLQVRPRRLIIFTIEAYVNSLIDIINRWNRIGNISFDIKQIVTSPMLPSHEMLEKILLAL